MTTNTTHFRTTIDRRRQITLSVDAFAKAALFFAFVISLFQYWISSPFAAIAPVVLIYLSGLCAFIDKTKRSALLRNLPQGGVVLILFSLFSELVSYFSGSTYSVSYGAILILLLISMRLIILQIGLPAVIRVFTHASLLCVLPLVVIGKRSLTEYRGDTRFDAAGVIHPNLLAFTLSGYVPVFVALAADLTPGKKRNLLCLATVVTLYMLFTTGSRGALLSLVFSLIILLVRVTLSGFFFRLRLTPLSLIGASVVVSIIVLALASGSRFEKIDSFVIAAMQVNSKQRGLHSGLSGRTSLWSFTISRLTGLEWVFGRGFRQGFVIDSGYVTVLFDNGLFGVVAVVGSFLRQLWLLWRSTSTPDLSGWWLYRLALLWLTTEYLLSSVTERFLWSYGNQFSLLMMFMLMCSQRELIGRDTSRYNLPGVSRHELTNLRG